MPHTQAQPQYNEGYPSDFIIHLQHIIEERDKTRPAHFINIAIDNLPMMISGYGHKICEQAMNALLVGLKGHMAQYALQCLIYRIQKDQIAIICYNETAPLSEQDSTALSQFIKQFAFHSDYGTMHILASLSTLTIPEANIAAQDVLNYAYVAIKNNRGVAGLHHYDTLMPDAEGSRTDMNMVSYINNAISGGNMCMAFQPIISSKTGNIVHYEALLRVKKPTGELTTAGPLIPVAERMGLIDIIDDLVLSMMVKELLASPTLHLSFNVSNLTANSTAWLQHFHSIAEKYPDIIPRMMIEITETAVHLDLNRTAYFVSCVQAHGAKVALDDFGSGYTSFRQLKSLCVDMIKIDGVFVRDLLDNQDNKLFINTMLNFTRGFGLETVAECVEDGETAKLLMELGVDYMQGYYFGYPEVKPCGFVDRPAL
jgi:EAL domain-containing protein (putative c-di-GMP-specific phosphodiesterase class I)/GGDEF domain-containing protein